MTLTNEEKDLIIDSLHVRRNLVETGEPTLSAVDAERSSARKHLLRALRPEQHKLIVQIDDLITKVKELK